jgi:hypothetical protein
MCCSTFSTNLSFTRFPIFPSHDWAVTCMLASNKQTADDCCYFLHNLAFLDGFCSFVLSGFKTVFEVNWRFAPKKALEVATHHP